MDTAAVALVIDSRKVGFNHHLLSVGMTFKKYTRPLAWSVHQGKKEQSRVEEQLAFFKPVANMMPSAVEIWGVGDRISIGAPVALVWIFKLAFRHPSAGQNNNCFSP